jgi:hypothetical protein
MGGSMMRFPLVVFVVSFLGLWLSVRLGRFLRSRHPLTEEERSDFTIVESASLTLLGLIIGFSFSMATSRYDLRKKCEAEEANAIGTAYVRASLLPAADAESMRTLLRKYLALRIQFYELRDRNRLERLDRDTEALQAEIWSTVTGTAQREPTFITTFVASSINDVLNDQGYTQAAWWNRLPVGAWLLMIVIALFGMCFTAYGIRKASASLLFVFPLLVSISFYLIADLDSPRGGMIRVVPQNLVSLANSFNIR